MVGPWTDDSNSSPFTAIMRPVIGPCYHTARIRPIDDTAHRKPIVSTTLRRPIVSTARRRPTVSTVHRCSVTTVNISPWLLWPSFKKLVVAATSKPQKKNCTDYKQTNKQDNKEINKQATYTRLSRLLHILHPLGIKVRHQCKYREQSSI